MSLKSHVFKQLEGVSMGSPISKMVVDRKMLTFENIITNDLKE